MDLLNTAIFYSEILKRCNDDSCSVPLDTFLLDENDKRVFLEYTTNSDYKLLETYRQIAFHMDFLKNICSDGKELFGALPKEKMVLLSKQKAVCLCERLCEDEIDLKDALITHLDCAEALVAFSLFQLEEQGEISNELLLRLKKQSSKEKPHIDSLLVLCYADAQNSESYLDKIKNSFYKTAHFKDYERIATVYKKGEKII